MNPAVWHGKIFTGSWEFGSATDIQVTEPATGETLATLGVGSAADIDQACKTAAAAQQAWTDTPFEERAAILRRAAALFEQHEEEIQTWIVRESGSIAPKAQLETRHAAWKATKRQPSRPGPRATFSRRPTRPGSASADAFPSVWSA